MLFRSLLWLALPANICDSLRLKRGDSGAHDNNFEDVADSVMQLAQHAEGQRERPQLFQELIWSCSESGARLGTSRSDGKTKIPDSLTLAREVKEIIRIIDQNAEKKQKEKKTNRGMTFRFSNIVKAMSKLEEHRYYFLHNQLMERFLSYETVDEWVSLIRELKRHKRQLSPDARTKSWLDWLSKDSLGDLIADEEVEARSPSLLGRVSKRWCWKRGSVGIDELIDNPLQTGGKSSQRDPMPMEVERLMNIAVALTSPKGLQYVASGMQRDKGVVLAAASHHGQAVLEYLTENMKRDQDVVHAANMRDNAESQHLIPGFLLLPYRTVESTNHMEIFGDLVHHLANNNNI